MAKSHHEQSRLQLWGEPDRTVLKKVLRLERGFHRVAAKCVAGHAAALVDHQCKDPSMIRGIADANSILFHQ
jgi:hypothetical protein